VHRYRAGEPWWLDTDELESGQEEATEARQTDDPREHKISIFITGQTSVRMDEILGPYCLDVPPERWTVRLRTEIGYVLSAMKWQRYRQRMPGGKLEWRYHPPGKKPESAPVPRPVPGFRKRETAGSAEPAIQQAPEPMNDDSSTIPFGTEC
jgi:hypothetical protein